MLFSKKDLLKIIAPLAIQGLFSVTIGMVDSMMVSSGGDSAFSGVSLISSLDIFLITIFTALTAGGSVVLAQAMGRGDREHACKAAKQLLYSATLVATFITVVVLTFRTPILRLLFGEVEDAVMENALSYFFFLALSFPFLAIENSISAIFRAQGDSMTSLKISVLMNLMNISGNAALIYGAKMGAAGAAIATLASRLVGASILLVIVHSKKRHIHIDNLLRYKPDFKIIKDILGIGIPNGIENSLFQFGRLLTASLISALGTVAIAANSAALNLANFQYAAGGAIQTAMIIVVGRCIGAGDKKQAVHYTKVLLWLGYVIVFCEVLIVSIFSPFLLKMYDGLTAESLKLALQLFIYHNVASVILWPTAFCLPPAFRAASDVRYTMMISVLSMWIFRVFGGYLLALDSVHIFGGFFVGDLYIKDISIPGLGLGVFGVWFATTADWIFRFVIFVIHFIRGKWLTKYKER